LTIADAQVEKNINEQLEQELRNTTWKGTYEASDSILQTTLQLVVVQYDYVGGEITHKGTGDSYLAARVTGDIVTQFKLMMSSLMKTELIQKSLQIYQVIQRIAN
jgi:hypothetical protein